MRKFKLILRIFLWLSLAVFFARLAYLAVVPSGQVTYDNNFSQRSDFISKFKPRERLGPTEAGQQKLIGDPVYLELRTPRPFWQADLTIKFKPADQPLIELGLLRDKALWRYELQPLYNKTLEDLYRSEQWGVIEEGGLLLLQRRETYPTMQAFLSAPPESAELAVYNYNLPTPWRLKNYQASGGVAWPWAIRGAYQFFTYIKNEDLNFEFKVQDLNQSVGADEVKVLLLNELGQEIKTVSLPDDGESKIGERSSERLIRLEAPALAEGVYRLELRAGDDIVTTHIAGRQSKMAFSGKLWLSDPLVENITMFMSGRRLEAQTNNPASRQSIRVGSANLALAQAYQKIILPLSATGTLPLALERGDVILATDGVFAPSASALINPQATKLTADFKINDNINYIIARYTPVKQVGDWLQARVAFDLRLAARDKGAYELMFSLPGLGLSATAPQSITLGEVRADLSGQTLKQFLGLEPVR